jgi:hypothetical protein
LHGFEPEAEAAEEYFDEADDGLGYYPDGTKRTLTDEQIAMFRHSEIHAMLRKRRLQKENGEVSDGKAVSASPAPPCPPTQEDSHKPADVDNTQPDKPSGSKKQQWATTSATTKAKNKRKRDRYAKRRKEIRLERGLPRRRSGRDGADSGIRLMGLMCRKTTPSISTTEKGNHYNVLATHDKGNVPSCRPC